MLTLLLAGGLAIAASVPVVHYDAGQTNSGLETVLTPARIAHGFGKLGSFAVDGLLFAQPLYVPAVAIAGRATNLLLVATMANSVYAFNADRPGSPPLWRANFGATRTSYPGCCSPPLFLHGAGIGILSTPAVDAPVGRLYVVHTNPAATWVLSAVDVASGAIAASVTIAGQVPGAGDSGDTVTGGMLQFLPAAHLQRPGLALANGRVYIAFGGVGDNRPWHGWLFAYNTADLSRAGVFCTTPSSYGGAVWQSGAAPSIDQAGNVYVITGNDNNNPDASEHGESVLKLSSTLSLLDWFTPANFATLDAVDADFSAGWPVLIPGTNLLVAAGKDFNAYAINTDCMGHLQGSTACALQTWKTNQSGTLTLSSGSYGAAFSNGRLFLPTTAGPIYGFALSGGTFNSVPFAVSTAAYGFPGPAQMAAAGGLLWVTTSAGSNFGSLQPGTLRALDAATFVEIWNSDSRAHDALGTLAKYVSPTVANGRVYVATQDSKVLVYGLIPSAVLHGEAGLRNRAIVR